MKKFLVFLFLPAVSFAQQYSSAIVNLSAGQSVLAADYTTGQPITVVCQGNGAYVPPTPVVPPQPVCNAATVSSRISTVLTRAQRAASGYCVRDYGVKHCGDKLQGDPQLASTQERLRDNLANVKSDINQVCQQRACSRYEEDGLVRDYNRVLEDIARMMHKNPDNGQYTRRLLNEADVRNLRLNRCGW